VIWPLTAGKILTRTFPSLVWAGQPRGAASWLPFPLLRPIPGRSGFELGGLPGALRRPALLIKRLAGEAASQCR
jgi:hypothetical protein